MYVNYVFTEKMKYNAKVNKTIEWYSFHGLLNMLKRCNGAKFILKWLVLGSTPLYYAWLIWKLEFDLTIDYHITFSAKCSA